MLILYVATHLKHPVGRVYDSELLAKLSFMNSLLSSELKTYIQITNKGDELVT